MLLLGLVDVPLWLILTIFIIIATYCYGTRTFGYWTKLGIPGPTPRPCIGTIFSPPTLSLYGMDAETIKKYGKVVGLYTGTSPELLTSDDEIITEVTIKQFHNFTDRRIIIRGRYFDDSLLNLHGEKWKLVRSKLSPTFTTGKLRKMTGEINRSAKSFVHRLTTTEGAFEAKELCQNYMMDCIASTAFGLRVDSQKDEQNEFNIMGKKIVDVNFATPRIMISMFAPTIFVKLLTRLGFELNPFNKQATEFFVNVIRKTLEGRAGEGKERNDFIQLMANALKGEDITDDTGPEEELKGGLTKEEIMSNALSFFLAGFDNVSLVLLLVMYNLACHQECQQKLIKEVDSIIRDSEDVSYDEVIKMQYLDQCVNETLRIYPPAFRVDRQAVCDVDICGLKLKKDGIVNIPILAIHRDPDIWPEPMKFDPERFSPERKANIKPTHFMPFGIGPRICIANRMAMFEIKVAIVQVLRKFKLMTCEKTEIPLKLSEGKVMDPVNGAWLAVEKRV